MPPEVPATETKQTGVAGPGAALRQARADLKLAPEDVAGILHLSARQIVALENDDYASLPGPTYVRGYLRGYAQLLGLSAEPIVESYNRLVATRKPVDLGKLAPKPEIRSDHQLVKFGTAAVVALILGLSAVWWQEQDEPAPPVVVQAPVATEPEEIAGPLIPETDVPAPIAGTGTAATKPVVAPTPPAATTNVPVAPAVSEPKPVVPITGPRGRLTIQTTLDSWADVRDANGNRLLYRVVPAGNTEAVEGVAPLSVFLGNAEGVRVEYNGEVQDIARYRRGDIARFTLGEPARTP